MKNWHIILTMIGMLLITYIAIRLSFDAIIYNPIELPICPYTQEKADIIATSKDDKLRIYVCETGV